MPFKSHLPEIMKRRGMSYEELQYRSGTAPDTIARARDSRIETCQLKTLGKLADALDVSIHELFDYSSEKNQPHPNITA
ncbi:helix-turn-helix domain-containing protein [Desulfovibrio sp. QI0442]